jgi:hypothetical protein
MTIKVGDAVVKKGARGAEQEQTGIIIAITNGARAKEYLIRWSNGVEETCRPGTFKANGVRARPQQVVGAGLAARAPPPEPPIATPEAEVDDLSSSDGSLNSSSEDSDDSRSSVDEAINLGNLLDYVGGAIAPPDIPAGGAIVLNGENAPARGIDMDGVMWERIEHVAVDTVTHYPRDPRLQWFRTIGNVAADVTMQKDIFDCFRLFFPEQFIQTILDLTNRSIAADATRVGGLLDQGELWKYFGIHLAMAVDPVGGPIDAFWNKPAGATPEETPATIRQYRWPWRLVQLH